MKGKFLCGCKADTKLLGLLFLFFYIDNDTLVFPWFCVEAGILYKTSPETEKRRAAGPGEKLEKESVAASGQNDSTDYTVLYLGMYGASQYTSSGFV